MEKNSNFHQWLRMPLEEQHDCFHPICSLAELQQHGRIVRTIEDRPILVLWTDDGVVALDPQCPHQHVHSLDRGTVACGEITCPNHGWTFSLRTGRARIGSGRIRLFAVRINDGTVEVALPEHQPRWMQS